MILYHKSNLVYIVVFPQFLIFQQNNSALTSVLIFFTSRHYYFFEKFKIVEKQLCKLNCSYGKVSHTLKLRKNRIHKLKKTTKEGRNSYIEYYFCLLESRDFFCFR